jgi:hypothetical protein
MWLAFPLGEKIGIHITTQQLNVCIVLNLKKLWRYREYLRIIKHLSVMI